MNVVAAEDERGVFELAEGAVADDGIDDEAARRLD